MVVSEGAEGYMPSVEYVEDSHEALINLTDSTELLLLKLPFSNDLLSEIHGQKLSLTLHNDGKLASFEDSSGKLYNFVSFATQEPDETVFISSATEPKIGKISSRVSTVHYPDAKELQRTNSTKAGHVHRHSSGGTGKTSSRYFPIQSGQVASSKGSRQKSAVSEVSDPSSTPKGKHVSKSNSKSMVSDGPSLSKPKSMLSEELSPPDGRDKSEVSHGGKSKRRKLKD